MHEKATGIITYTASGVAMIGGLTPNDFYRRCRLREMEVRSAEDLGQTYWGLPWVRARAELMREQFGFECWR